MNPKISLLMCIIVLVIFSGCMGKEGVTATIASTTPVVVVTHPIAQPHTQDSELLNIPITDEIRSAYCKSLGYDGFDAYTLNGWIEYIKCRKTINHSVFFKKDDIYNWLNKTHVINESQQINITKNLSKAVCEQFIHKYSTTFYSSDEVECVTTGAVLYDITNEDQRIERWYLQQVITDAK